MKLKRFLLRRIAVRGRNVSLSDDTHIGLFTRIWAPSEFVVESNVYIGKFCTIECDGRIGPGSLIANYVGIVGRKDHDYSNLGIPISNSNWVGNDQRLRTSAIIGADVWIGYGSVILAPVRIGNSSIIAAGSVVINDVPPFSIVGGNPAKVIGTRFSTELERESHLKSLAEKGML
jgi:acetyltransferase-like isoleucine patch superfamily enzyme